MHKRVAIIYPTSYFSTVPSLVAMVKSLIENGYEVDLFHCGQSYFSYKSKFTEFNLKEPFSTGTSGWRLNFIIRWLPKIVLESRRRKYLLLIGVDPYGLLIAGVASKIFKIPFAYFSLEILLLNELRSKYLKILKYTERYFSRRASFIIIQDPERGKLLIKENRLEDNARLFYLPNTVDGEATKVKSDYLRKKYGIARDSVIILYSGSFHPDFMNVELAEVAYSCDKNYVFVFHSGKRINLDDSYIREFLKKVDNKKIIFDTMPLNDTDYEEMISSADIGVALYSTVSSKNIFTIGLSSGKVARYLKSGVPVIVSELPLLAEMVNEYRCGVTVSTVDQFIMAISTIIQHYPTYSANAIRCFNEKLNFRKHFSTILEYLDTITGDRGS